MERLEPNWLRMHDDDNEGDDGSVSEDDDSDVNCDGDGRGCDGNDDDDMVMVRGVMVGCKDVFAFNHAYHPVFALHGRHGGGGTTS